MSRAANVNWAMSVIKPEWIIGKRVLDIGSRDWTGENPKEVTIHDWVRSQGPLGYMGVDTKPGPNVDRVLNGKDAVESLGQELFDLVLCLEVLEHEQDWHSLAQALKWLVAPGGHIVLTTRMPGYPWHGYPDDFWRFNGAILKEAFVEFEVLSLLEDDDDKGVYIALRKANQHVVTLDISIIKAPEVVR